MFSQTLLFRFFFGEQGQQNLPLALVGHTRQQLAVAVDILIVDDRLFEIKFARIDPERRRQVTSDQPIHGIA